MTTKPIKYIISDDDPIYRSLTVSQLSLLPDLVCVGECESAIQVGTLLQEKSVDLLLLDIEMPNINGLQFARSLQTIPFIIFISSHTHYAVEAFEVDAIDYLIKPVLPERLYRAINKVRNLLELKKAVSSESIKMSDDSSFFIKERNTYCKLYYDDILYIESLADFVQIYLTDGSKKIALVNLKNLEPQLPSFLFIRISRTHIIHKQKISAIDSNHIVIQKVQLPLGKSYVETVMQSIVGNTFIKRYI